ncbi:hypothetical protein GCM10027360_80780 [Amycolatopsis echigonensis]
MGWGAGGGVGALRVGCVGGGVVGGRGAWVGGRVGSRIAWMAPQCGMGCGAGWALTTLAEA